MPNPLDPIWDAHLTAQDALKVVRRCVTVPGIDRARAFSNTRYDGLTDQQYIDLLDAAQTEVNDSAVLSLYATFEARFRDHIAQQAHHLHVAVIQLADLHVLTFRSLDAGGSRPR
jgi:hypothetical protein